MKKMNKLICLGLLTMTASGISFAEKIASTDSESAAISLPVSNTIPALASNPTKNSTLLNNLYSKVAASSGSINLPAICSSGGCSDSQRQEIKKNLKIFADFLSALSFTVSDDNQDTTDQNILNTSNVYREKLTTDLNNAEKKPQLYDQYCGTIFSLKLLAGISLLEKK
jgi:hypothetical protein